MTNSDGGELLLGGFMPKHEESRYLSGQVLPRHGGDDAVEGSTSLHPPENIIETGVPIILVREIRFLAQFSPETGL